VTGRDAQLIAQHVVHLNPPLTGAQQLAGDASGNGVVSAFDAGLVSQFAIQLINHLPVANLQSSDWKFLRCDNYPNCAPVAEYAYPELLANETAPFYAIFYGDVSGNWQSAAALQAYAAPAATLQAEADALAKDRLVAARLAGRPRLRSFQRTGDANIVVDALRGPVGRPTDTVLYISAENAVGIQGLDLTFDYDPSNISIVDVQAVDQDSGFQAVWKDTPGSLQIAFFGYAPVEHDGRLVKITVHQSSGRRAIVAPRLRLAHANEGAIRTRIVSSHSGTWPRDRELVHDEQPGGTGGNAPDSSPAVLDPSPTPVPRKAPAGATAIKKDESVTASTAVAGPIGVPRASSPSVYVENAIAPAEGSSRRTVFVSTRDSSGIEDLELTFDYDASKVSIVDVKVAPGSSGNEATWRDEHGTLRVTLRGGVTPGESGRLLEITAESADGSPAVALELTRARAGGGGH